LRGVPRRPIASNTEAVAYSLLEVRTRKPPLRGVTLSSRQNSSSASFEVWVILILPTSGTSTGRCHNQLRARVLKNAAAEGLLFHGRELQAERHGRQRGAEPGGARPYDEQVQHPLALLPASCDGLDRFPPLHESVPDQAHSSQLSCDEHPGDVGLEIRCQHRNVDTALFSTEHQRDRANRTRGATGPMTDAIAGHDELGLAVDQPQHVRFRLLRARFDAFTAPYAPRGIYHRMQGNRFREARTQRLLVRRAARALDVSAFAYRPSPDEQQGDEVNNPDPVSH
jgi:hypothetical protein